MKKKMQQTARSHHSQVLEDFLSLGTEEEFARTKSRMMLAAKIQDAMAAKNIGKKELAEMMGQQPSVITKWLSGKHNFTTDTLTDIQRVLGVRLLALEGKPVTQNVYHITINLISPQPQQILPPKGQTYSLPSAQTDMTRTPKENLERQLAYA